MGKVEFNQFQYQKLSILRSNQHHKRKLRCAYLPRHVDEQTDVGFCVYVCVCTLFAKEIINNWKNTSINLYLTTKLYKNPHSESYERAKASKKQITALITTHKHTYRAF